MNTSTPSVSQASQNDFTDSISTSVADIQIWSSTKVLHITELREMIMDELDPLTLLNFVSTSHTALETFERCPERYMNAALKHVPVRVARAILAAHRSTPSDDVVVEEPKHTFIEESTFEYHVTELDEFLNQYISPRSVESGPIPFTMQSLKTLAGVYDIVETLLYSRIWNCVDDPKNGASSLPGSTWYSEVEEIGEALWYFHLYCVLFHRRPTTECGEVEFPSVYSQYKFMPVIEEKEEYEFKHRFLPVYKDLLSFLALFYKRCWALRFKEVYMNHVSRSNALIQGIQWSKEDWPYSRTRHSIYSPQRTHPLDRVDDGVWSDSFVVYDTYGEFFKYVDYHMSLGVPFLAQIYRCSLDPSFTDYPDQRFWTISFFPQAYDELLRGNAELRDT